MDETEKQLVKFKAGEVLALTRKDVIKRRWILRKYMEFFFVKRPFTKAR